MANQKKIKLREQQEFMPFMMAILKGANINERWKGAAIVTHYFDDLCWRTFNCFNSQTYYQTKLKKVKCLILFGADISEIFERGIYKDLIFSIGADLSYMLLMIHCGGRAKHISDYRRILLKNFQQELTNTDKAISEFSPGEQPEENIAEISELLGNLDGYHNGHRQPLAYDDIILSVINKLILLSVLLKSTFAPWKINGWRYEALQILQQTIRHVGKVITDTGLTAGMGKMPDWTDIGKEYIAAFEEVSQISHVKREITEEDIAFLYDINDLIESDNDFEEECDMD